MGVGKLLSHTGKGLYAVELQFRNDFILKQRADLAKLKKELDEELVKLQEKLDETKQEIIDTQDDLDLLIVSPLFPLTHRDILNGLTTQEEKREFDIRQLQRKLVDLNRVLVDTEERIKVNNIKYAPVIANKQLYDDHSTSPPLLEVWCVDYSQDLIIKDKEGNEVETFVETIESMDEYNDPNQFINLRPVVGKTLKELEGKIDSEGRLTLPGEVDKRTLPHNEHVLNSGAWTIAWNWMTLPSMQTWRPYYKIANITSIDHQKQTCRISYQNQEFRSSIRPFPVDFDTVDFTGGEGRYQVELNTVHDNVPIVYMECGSSVFKKDDEVIVEYIKRDPEKPRVIGFRHDPKRCLVQYLIYISNQKLLAREISSLGGFSNTQIDLFKTETEVLDWRFNLEQSLRLNCGQLMLNDENDEEIENVYSFDIAHIYRNGVDLELFTVIPEQINARPQIVWHFPNVMRGRTISFGVGIYESFAEDHPIGIVGIEVYESKLYVLAEAKVINATGRMFAPNTILKAGDPVPLPWRYLSGWGFLVLVYNIDDEGNLFLIDQIHINTEVYTYAEPRPGQANIAIPFFNRWDEATPFNLTTRGGGNSVTKILGFSVNAGYILLTFTSGARGGVSGTPWWKQHSSSMMLVDVNSGLTLSDVWLNHRVDDPENLGYGNLIEQFNIADKSDKVNYDPIFDPNNELLDGYVKINGKGIVNDPGIDVITSTGEVTG